MSESAFPWSPSAGGVREDAAYWSAFGDDGAPAQKRQRSPAPGNGWTPVRTFPRAEREVIALSPVPSSAAAGAATAAAAAAAHSTSPFTTALVPRSPFTSPRLLPLARGELDSEECARAAASSRIKAVVALSDERTLASGGRLRDLSEIRATAGGAASASGVGARAAPSDEVLRMKRLREEFLSASVDTGARVENEIDREIERARVALEEVRLRAERARAEEEESARRRLSQWSGGSSARVAAPREEARVVPPPHPQKVPSWQWYDDEQQAWRHHVRPIVAKIEEQLCGSVVDVVLEISDGPIHLTAVRDCDDSWGGQQVNQRTGVESRVRRVFRVAPTSEEEDATAAAAAVVAVGEVEAARDASASALDALPAATERLILTAERRMRYQAEFADVPEDLVAQLADEVIAELAREVLDEVKPFAQLSSSDAKRVDELVRGTNARLFVCSIGDAELCVKNLNTLQPLAWLDDEVMNAYISLLIDRNTRALRERDALNAQTVRLLPAPHVPRVVFFTTFFCAKLVSGGTVSYTAVRRWNRLEMADPLKLDLILVPVHVHGSHWCLSAINVRRQRFEYYDSMGGGPEGFLAALRVYFGEKLKECYPNGPAVNLAKWPDYCPDPDRGMIPRQTNGSDCGVFTLSMAEFLSDGRELTGRSFSQSDMLAFRKRIAAELVVHRRVL